MQADNPIPDGMSWYAEPPQPSPERPRLTFDLDVDVGVVGGGLAGLTTAREIARRGWSVALLEAQTVGFGASGRNLGFVIPGFQESIDRIVERVGMDHARELWALSEGGVDYVRDTIRDTAMPGVEPVGGWINVSKFREDSGLNSAATLLRENFGAQVETWSKQQVREVLRSPLYQNAIYYPRAFQVDPLNYTLGLAAAAEQAGVRIFEHTPALSIDPAGIRKRIGTPSARLRASQIVLAGNTGLGGLMPRLAASLLPVTSFVAVTAPLGDTLQQAVTFKGGVSDSDTVDNHYRIIDGNRLMWSGGQRVSETDPARFKRRLAGDIQRAYPQLGRVEIAHVWSGTASIAVHSMPQIGEFARGVWVANGFAGQGINTTAMAGQLIARGIVENDETWRLFAPYDLVWAGGSAGRAALQVRYWAHRTKERIDALLLAEDMPEESIVAAAPEPAVMPAEPVTVPGVEQPALEIPVAPAEPAAAEAEPVPPADPAAAEPEPVPPAEKPPAKPRKKRAPRKTTTPKKAAAPRKRTKKAAVAEDKTGTEVETEPPAAAGRVTADN